MSKRARRHVTPEFKARAVELVHASAGTKSLGQIAKDLDLSETALRERVKKAEGPAARGPDSAPTTSSEQHEIARLKRELQQVKMERDFLKKAAAFFAKESS